MSRMIRNLIMCTLIFIFNRCTLIHYMSVDYKKNPESKMIYNKYLNSLNIDTTDSYELSGQYFDSISTEKYAVNMYKLKTGATASPVEIRMYDNSGKLINGYEQCYGEISKLGILKTFPMKKLDWLPTNYNLTLINDLNLLNISKTQKAEIVTASKKYDFVIAVYYAKWAGWYSSSTLKKVKAYIKKNSTSKILFIKINTAQHPNMS